MDVDFDFELGEDGEAVGIPGFRRSFHRPVRRQPAPGPATPPRTALRDEDEAEDEAGRVSATTKTAIAKARKETALAGLNELQLQVKSGEYLPRAAYQDATATLLAMLSQGLRSLPDTIERKFDVPPDVLQLIEATIDASLSHVADSLALFSEARG